MAAKKGPSRKQKNDDVSFTPPPRRVWLVWLRWAATVAVWGAVAVAAVLAFYAVDLPDVDDAIQATRKRIVTIRAADGATLATFGDQYGRPVRLKDVAKTLPQAILATEDRRFYSHFGLDVIGLARAMATNIMAGRIKQGGSTLTQQVAKNLFLTHERSLKRKVQELLLALWLEQKFTKDQILTLYLNRVYLGAGAYGVEAAAYKYFNRPARTLSLYQSAMVAGLLKAPSRYNPLANATRAHGRTVQVLRNMAAAGYISRATAEATAKSGEGTVTAHPDRGRGRYFVDWVLSQVSDLVGGVDRDLIVRTSLDTALQRRAEDTVEKTLAANEKKSGVSQAAVVVLEKDGAVRALVGGRAYGDSQFNRATQARRQPGSAFKPFVYLAGLEKGIAPDDTYTDAPVTVDGWTPRNFDKKYKGRVTVAQAFANSINTVAVMISEKAGRKTVIDVARRFGLTGKMKAHPSLALGAFEVSPLELAAAYVPFANGGQGVWAYGIEDITDTSGRVLYRRRGGGPGRVADADHVAALNDMMAAVVATGTARRAGLPRGSAGKTGTSQGYRDAWFAGHARGLSAVVWMGNDTGQGMKGVTGGGLPARLWARIMGAPAKRVAPPPPPKSLPPPPEPNFIDRVLRFLGGG